MADFDREVDSLTGLVTDIGFEEGKMKIRYSQDTSIAHEINSQLRDNGDFSANGIKANMWNVVRLTDADCLKMMVEDGINPYTASATELRKHLSRNRDKWGHVFTTRGKF